MKIYLTWQKCSQTSLKVLFTLFSHVLPHSNSLLEVILTSDQIKYIMNKIWVSQGLNIVANIWDV